MLIVTQEDGSSQTRNKCPQHPHAFTLKAAFNLIAHTEECRPWWGGYEHGDYAGFCPAASSFLQRWGQNDRSSTIPEHLLAGTVNQFNAFIGFRKKCPLWVNVALCQAWILASTCSFGCVFFFFFLQRLIYTSIHSFPADGNSNISFRKRLFVTKTCHLSFTSFFCSFKHPL